MSQREKDLAHDDGNVRWVRMAYTLPYVAAAIIVIRIRIRAADELGRLQRWLDAA